VASNAIVDSGNPTLMLDQGLYDKVVALFGAVNADFGSALQKYAPNAGGGCEQTQLDLTRWPPIRLILQGSDGGQVAVSVAPQDYWQFDCGQRGSATTALCGDGGMLGGQSNLGLPIFCGHYVVFDRTASSGHGVIGFATRTGV
jgi:hypothetical protein